MKHLLFPFIAFICVFLTSAPGVACENKKDAKALFLEYPVVVVGQFQTIDHFDIKKVYKGFRTRPIEIDLSGIDKSKIQIGQPAILVSPFEGQKAVLRNCGHILYDDRTNRQISYPTVLAEAVVYNAVAERKLATKFGEQEWRKYEETSAYFRDKRDYLGLLEMSLRTLRDLLLTNDTGSPVHLPRVHMLVEGNFNQCVQSLSTDSAYLTKDLMDKLRTTANDGMILYSSLFRDAVNDFGRSLIAIKDYDAAIYDLCATDTESLWLQAVLAAKRPDILGNRALGRVHTLSDVDLSGLTLRGIHAGGRWQRVKVEGTDFTNADFTEARFEEVYLDKANLDLATYSCETQFLMGFDPVAHHMIPAWKFHGCDRIPQPKINLANVQIKPSSSGAHSDYGAGAVVLRFINFENVDARSSVLGTIYCDCKINNADFTGTEVALRLIEHITTISNSSFRNAKLSGSDFHQATFQNVDFTGADLSDVNFDRATYDASTKWPSNFNPEASGLVKSTQ